MRTLTVLALAALSAAGPLAADDKSDATTTPAAADTGLVFWDYSPFEKLPSWIQLGGQIRGRFDGVSGTSLTNDKRMITTPAAFAWIWASNRRPGFVFSPRPRTRGWARTTPRLRPARSTTRSTSGKLTPS